MMIFKSNSIINWLSIIFVFNVLAPTTTIGYVFRFISLFLSLVFFRRKKAFMQSGLIVVLVIYVSFMLGFFLGDNIPEYKTIIKLVVIAITIGLFPLCDNNEISIKLLLFTIVFILGSQIVFAFKISPIINLIDIYYPVTSEHYQANRIMSISEASRYSVFFRYGGIYRNGNYAARMVSLILAVFLTQKRESGFKDVSSIVFLLLILISIILTGSRTGFIIIGLLIGYKLFYIQRIKYYRKTIIFVFISYLIFLLGSLNIRSLQLVKGVQGSLGVKAEFLLAYFEEIWKNGDIIRLLFGNFTYSIESTNILITASLNRFDSGIGYILFSLGIFGLISIIFFFIYLKKNTDIYYNILLIILFWMITSTILFSLNFGLVYFFALSFSYRKISLPNK